MTAGSSLALAAAPAVAPVAAAPGMLLLGKYRLLRRLGRGGMGEVWLARNEATDREFAIKLLLAELAESSDMHARFLREAKIAGSVRHPGIVQIFDVARAPELDGAIFMVMEVLQGESLHELMVREKRPPLGFLLDVSIAIAHALGALHDREVVHRDLKPSNIFLHRDGSGRIVPKLLDFGISKVAATPDAGELTRTGTIIGSPRYMSPEQAAGRKDVDARADVHGLGITFWTCAAGQSPFDASNYNTMIVSVIASERPRLRTVVPEVPEVVSEVIARAIERDREQRFGDGHELARALEAVRGAVRDGSGLGERWTASEAPAPTADEVSVSFDLASYIRTIDVGAPVSTAPPATASRRALHVAAATCAAVATLLLVLVAGRLVFPERASQPATPATLPVSAAPQPAVPTPAGEALPLAPAPVTVEPPPPSAPRLAAPVHAPLPIRNPPPREREQDDPHHGVTSSGL